MDRTLLVLLASAWKTGDRADVAALVDRIKETPAEEVIETFLAARTAALLPGKLADVGRAMAEVLAPAFAALGPVLASMGQALLAVQEQQQQATTPPQQPGPTP